MLIKRSQSRNRFIFGNVSGKRESEQQLFWPAQFNGFSIEDGLSSKKQPASSKQQAASITHTQRGLTLDKIRMAAFLLHSCNVFFFLAYKSSTRGKLSQFTGHSANGSAIHLFSLLAFTVLSIITTVANTNLELQSLPVAAALCHQKSRRLFFFVGLAMGNYVYNR